MYNPKNTPHVQAELLGQKAFILKIFCILLSSITLTTNAIAQPYIDLVNARYAASPDLVSNGNKSTLNYTNLSLSLPLKFRNSDILLINPYAEKWTTEIEGKQSRQSYYGLVLPVSYLKNFRGSGTSLVMMGILRMNDEKIDNHGNLQVGGAALISFKKNPDLTWKFGLYVNGELFGLFLVPLAGIDWKIDDRSNLFGVLPASLTYERKLNTRVYSGLTFRTFTNSYANDSGYWRIDENQIGAFTDLYLARHIVLNGELGSSILRKIRTGTESKAKENWNVKDNLYFKISLAYRVRLR